MPTHAPDRLTLVLSTLAVLMMIAGVAAIAIATVPAAPTEVTGTAAVASQSTPPADWYSIGWLLLAGGLVLGMLAAGLRLRARREERERTALFDGLESSIGRRDSDALPPNSNPKALDADSVEVDAAGIEWLRPTAKTRRRTALVGLLVIGIVILGMVPYTLTLLGAPGGMPFFVLFGGAMVFIVMIAGASVLGMNRVAIGWDGETLRLVSFTGREERIRPEEAIHTGNRLVGRRLAVPLRNPKTGKSIFDPEAFDRLVGPHLDESNHRSEGQLLWSRLRHGDLKTWLQVLAALGVLAAMIWNEFLR